MKVALIGNMNNNFFALMRYLLDLNVDAHLYLFRNEAAHFLPESDSFKPLNYQGRIHLLPFSNSIFDIIRINGNVVNAIVGSYDILIGCGYAPAYIAKAGRTLDIFSPYGSDFYAAPFIFKNIANRTHLLSYVAFLLRLPLYIYATVQQKKGIRESKHIFSLSTINTAFLIAARKLHVQCEPMSIPMVYPENLKYFPSEIENVISILKESEISIVSQSRQYWKSSVELDSNSMNKGNHILIHGFAKYLKRMTFKKPLLVLFEYGPDVQASKCLIKQLQIENNVLWVPLISRKYIMCLLQEANFGADQFISPYFGGTGNEHLAAGVPFFCKVLTNEEYREMTGHNLPPGLLPASTPEEICEYLLDYEVNKEKYKHLGAENKMWFDNYAGIGLAKKYKHVIDKLYNEKY